jgi:hypothetical protein
VTLSGSPYSPITQGFRQVARAMKDANDQWRLAISAVHDHKG